MRGGSLVVLVVGVVAATGCIEHNLVRCGDEYCPAGTQCVPTGCATGEQVAVCEGKEDGTECETLVNVQGHCLMGTCLDSICGDGITEFGEACDDGNIKGGDGCSERCDSTETCGNNVIDLPLGEQCDQGVAFVGGDGCSSTCAIEIDVWRDVTPVGIPNRENHMMVYDPVRGALVVFGGQGDEGTLGDTWTYSQGNWTRQSGPSPSPRRSAVFVYDALDQRAILFGGHDGDSPLDDTWAWDGFSWQQLSPSNRPPPRHRAAAAYDDVNDRIVMFGGSNSQSPRLGDTWLWNGSNWNQQMPTNNPGARIDHAMAYDANIDRILMYGGTTAVGDNRQTWYWNGANWNMRDVAADDRPPVHTNMTLTYDEGRDRVVLFGGEDETNNLERSVTWRYIPGTPDRWSEFGVSAHPSARKNAASAYLPGYGVVVMGGSDRTMQRLGDLWWFDENNLTWKLLQPTTRPALYRPVMTYDPIAGRSLVWSPGYYALWNWDGQVWTSNDVDSAEEPRAYDELGFVYDEKHKKAVLFGGRDYFSPGGYSNDTWLLDDTGWTKAMPATRPPAGHAALVYDSQREVVVAVITPVTPGPLQTWEWDNTNWTERVSSTAAPSVRTDYAIAYDRDRGRVVLFGGFATSEYLAETWEWDGSAWHKAAPETSPAERRGHVLVYDLVRRTTVLFGGRNSDDLNDTWEWNGSDWRRRPDLTAATARSDAAATYDRARHKIVVTGPYSSNGTWTYGFEPLDAVSESCMNATDDLDGDGRAGCMDPDCWGRCAPLCPPGEPCDTAQPRCGNGVCDPIEDHLLCPQDSCAAP